tara:strand:- start:206 stop:421 length:216 start_codon:yes stop_codon:yes gene_type:complete
MYHPKCGVIPAQIQLPLNLQPRKTLFRDRHEQKCQKLGVYGKLAFPITVPLFKELLRLQQLHSKNLPPLNQ